MKFSDRFRASPFRLARAATVAGALLAAGCGLDSGSPPIDSTYSPQQMPQLGDGKIFIAWTLGGAAPGAASCAGVDHLALSLGYLDGAHVTIEPIPCTLTKFRYDGMPDGGARIDLVGYDASSCRVTRGSTSLTVSPALPATPSPVVALSAVTACR